jgi:hypothetical protein
MLLMLLAAASPEYKPAEFKAAIALSAAVMFRSGRSSFEALTKLSVVPVLGLNHSNVDPAGRSLRANAYASLNDPAFLMLFLF